MVELTITIKDEKSKLVEKEMVYDSFVLSPDNQELMNLVEKHVKKFKQDPNSEAPAIIVKAKLVVQS